jgi:hypothetical protein
LTFLGEGAEPAAGEDLSITLSTTRRLFVVVLTISPLECTLLLGDSGVIVAKDSSLKASLTRLVLVAGWLLFCTLRWYEFSVAVEELE